MAEHASGEELSFVFGQWIKDRRELLARISVLEKELAELREASSPLGQLPDPDAVRRIAAGADIESDCLTDRECAWKARAFDAEQALKRVVHSGRR